MSTPRASAVPSVWVVNDAGQDLEHAKTFGELRTLTRGKVNVFSVDQHIHLFRNALSLSEAEDWLVPTGGPALGIIAAVEMLRRHRRLNLLLWHARQRVYVPRIIKANFEADISEPFLQAVLQSEDRIEL